MTITSDVSKHAVSDDIEPNGRVSFIHHVNFPTTDVERTKEWYLKVFGLKHVPAKSNTRVLLLTRGNFDMHFTPTEEMDRMAPYHFAVEVDDWEGFLAHLKKLGVRHTRPVQRPENNSWFCYIHDPDHTMIEIVWHKDRRPLDEREPGLRPGYSPENQ